MRITQFFGAMSKNAQYMRWDYEHAHGTVYSRYERPSQAKMRSWNNIVDGYRANDGIHHISIKGVEHTLHYRYDVRAAGVSSHFYSTIASFEDIDTGIVYLVKETYCNTYMCEL